MACAGLPMSGKSSGSACVTPPINTSDATTALNRALRTEKERMFTAFSVVRGEGAVKRHYMDLNPRCTFIADAICAMVVRRGQPRGFGRASCCRSEADTYGAHGRIFAARRGGGCCRLLRKIA